MRCWSPTRARPTPATTSPAASTWTAIRLRRSTCGPRAGTGLPAQLTAALLTGESFAKLYSNGTRQGTMHVDRPARGSDSPQHAGGAGDGARRLQRHCARRRHVVVEATLHPWQQPARNVRIPIELPARLESGQSAPAGFRRRHAGPNPGSATARGAPADLETALAQARRLHPADRIYVSLLAPEAQADMEGQTLSALPLSMANALEPLHTAQDVTLNGESAVVAAKLRPAGCSPAFRF